jgi:hypothetical protein
MERQIGNCIMSFLICVSPLLLLGLSVKKNEMSGAYSAREYKVLVRNPEGKRPDGRPRVRWV